MNIIASTLKTIIEAQGLNYFRSVNINDLNQQVGEKDVSAGLGVYTNLPEIVNRTFGKTNAVLMEYSVEVYYLQLNAETDDKGEAVDVILDALKPLADGLIDQINRSGIIATGQFIEDYNLDAVETLKMTKEVLSGWRLAFAIPIFRSVFDCEI